MTRKYVLQLSAWITISIISACTEKDEQRFAFHVRDVELPAIAKSSIAVGSYILIADSNNNLYVVNSQFKRDIDAEQRVKSLKIDFNDVQMFYGDALFYSIDGYTVLDTNLDRKPEAEQILDRYKIQRGFYYEDALLFGEYGKLKAILPGYKVVDGNLDSFCKEHMLMCKAGAQLVFSDSIYKVYACGPMGEFNGTIYFQNKRTKKVYTMPAYFSGIDTFNGIYYITQSSRNWREPNTSYTKVKDPTTLFPNDLRENNLICNGDSGYYKWELYSTEKKDIWEKRGGAWEYYRSFQFWTLQTFINKDNLYSLTYNDSMYFVVKHSDSVRVIDSVKVGKGSFVIKSEVKGNQINIVRVKSKSSVPAESLAQDSAA